MSGVQVPCISLLAELSGELDKWLSGAKDIPDTVHNRAVRNAVSVVADAVAITRARLEARQSDAARTANAGREDDMKWIPVEKQMPAGGRMGLSDDVLVTVSNIPDNFHVVRVDRYDAHAKAWENAEPEHEHARVTAWMPKPEAYTPPPVQSVQSDEDRREKSESRAGIDPFQVNAERRAVDRIL